MQSHHLGSACIAMALALTGCGGGSGGAGEGVASAPPPPSAPLVFPPPLTIPTTKNFDTAEYRQSRTAINSNAIGAWQHGASGLGVKIGFVDTGLNPALSEFSGRIDPASKDVAGSRSMGDSWGHGTAVASIAAGARDDSGMQGVAFDASIVMMRADDPGSCPSNCSFGSGAVAAGIDAARLAGARVINLSIGGSEAASAIEDAVRRATNAGIIVVIGAGNDGNANPTGLARELAAISPGRVIIVGALGIGSLPSVNYDQMVTYSNLAGLSISSYLTAPGFLVRVAYGEGSYDIVSGTSFAAPVVAGAVALLAQAFPSLSAGSALAVDIVRKSSTPRGDANVTLVARLLDCSHTRRSGRIHSDRGRVL